MKKLLTGFLKHMLKAMTFTTKAYANPVSGDTTPPRILLPNVNGNVLWLIYSEPLDPTSVPAGSDFTVWRGYFTTQVPVVNVTVADNIIILTLAVTFNVGDYVFASYKPGSIPIRDLAGNNITVAFNNQYGYNSTGGAVPLLLTLPTVKGNVLQITYHEPLDTTSVPAGSAFTVKVNGTAQAAPTHVSIAGSIVTVILKTAVKAGDSVTVGYTPGSSPIRYAAGYNAGLMSNMLTINITEVDNVPPVLVEATVNDATLRLLYSEFLNTASVPAGSNFIIKVNGTAQAVPLNVTVVDSAVILTLASAVKPGDLVSISYTFDSNPIRDNAGNNAAALTDQVVTNNTVDSIPPVLSGAVVNEVTLQLTYSEPLDMISIPVGSNFIVKVNGTAQAVPLNVAVVDSSVTLTLASAVKSGEIITVSYTPGSSPIRDTAGNNAASLTDQLVTNNTVGLVVPPIDPTVATSVYDSTAFLYTGDNPVQTGMVPETIEIKRAAVLRGKVLDREGTPIAGVEITIPGHPEFGRTQTRADGYFDMAVNGGGLLTVNYSRDGYLPVQRQANVPWQDFALLRDVVMVSYDSSATAIDLTASVMQVAQGGQVADADGIRRAVLLIPPGTTAELTLPDGTKQPLTNLDVRATEYTVGDSGPAAMPGDMPPNIGYTYAVEYSVDQAVAARAKEVRFNQPLFHYVENFLNFPVGGIVPVGYYDRDKVAWIPSDNGRIVKVLSITNGLADLDITGSATAADTTALAALGVTDEERQQLAGRYQPDQSLWRVPITHFTPWDCNWPYGPPSDAEAPDQPECKDDDLDDPCEAPGSIIELQNQVLGEKKSIIGTPFSLYYSSSRGPGYQSIYSKNLPLSGASIPASLNKIKLEITVAGRQFSEEFPAEPNKSYTFNWDGMDVYGRALQGEQAAHIAIGYTYEAVYQAPANFAQSFGSFSGVPITGNRSRQEVVLWQNKTAKVGGLNALNQGLGGWALDVQHVYNSSESVLLLGDGGRRSAQSISCSITTVVGNGDCNGSLATAASLDYPEGVAVGADGSLYVSDSYNHCIRRVGPDGVITTVAGNGTAGYSGDGGSAVKAQLDTPYDVVVTADGSLYIADTYNNCIRQVRPDGIITTVAGTGIEGYSGDGGQATSAQLDWPQGLALGTNGSLYITDAGNCRVRRIDSDGIITTIAGNGTWGYTGDGGPATAASLDYPEGLFVGTDGSLYIADMGNSCIRRVGTDGIITTVAGNGTSGYSGDDSPATSAQLYWPYDMVVGLDGSLYIADTCGNRIRRVDHDGIITTVAGSSAGGYRGDNGPATAAQLACPESIVLGTDGSLYIADTNNWLIRRIGLDGIITTVAGNGRSSYSGDGRLAKSAQLNWPEGVTQAADGSLYIADEDNHCVRRVGPNGTIATVVGVGTPGYSGDGGPAAVAKLYYPDSVALGTDGSLYIADRGNNCIRWVGPDGIITTIAGNPSHGVATAVSINAPEGVALGTDGSLYIADRDGSRIYRVDNDGILTVIAGTGTPGYSGDGGLATAARLRNPRGLVSGLDGSLYIADTGNSRIRRIGLDGIITTVAGDGTWNYSGDGGPAIEAQFYSPEGLAAGADGSLYIGDAGNRCVRRIGPDGTIITVAGNGSAGYSGDGGPAIAAQLSRPRPTVGADGSLYIADTTNHRIRRVGLDGIITTVAGNGTRGYSGDGGPATAASLNYPASVAVGSDGSMYIADYANNRMRRVGPDGIITTVAGTGIIGYSGDGGTATAAQLNYPSDVVLGMEGSLYIADRDNYRIRRVGTAGIITTVAGNGYKSYSGDGGPATAAQLSYPTSVCLGADGSVFFADVHNNRVRRVGPDGIITTVAGTGTYGYSGDGGPASQAKMAPSGIAVGADGSLFIADVYNERVRRVGSDGIITTVVGNGSAGYSGDGGPATAAQLNYPNSVSMGADGILYIGDYHNSCVRRVGPDGIITTVAGSGTAGYSGDEGPATKAQLHYPTSVCAGADGLYISDGWNNRIRRVASSLPGVSYSEIPIPAEDGSEVYIFDTQGRHLRTVNALNETIIYLFNYNATGHLVSVEDRDGNITNIERDASGIPTAIVAPGGQRTALTVNADSYLDGIACPLGEVTRLAYDSNGLLTSLTDHKGNIHQYTYDAMGRLIKDADPAGGYTALARAERDDGYAVTATTALGRSSTYSVEHLSAGGMRHVNTNPSGAQIIAQKGTDGITTATYPDGTVAKTVKRPDPRWGMQAPLISSTVTTPGGLQSSSAQTGSVMYDPADATRMKTLSYTTSVNGRKYTSTYDAELNQMTKTTPLGLKSLATLDARGRVIQDQVDSLDPVNYTYDSRGNLTNVNQSDQAVTYVYDSKNRVISATDIAGNQTQYVYDDANRVTSTTAANGSIYQYAYDANGNCIQIIMPNGAVHNLDYTVLNQDASYTPPENGAYAASYDLDKAPIRTLLPGGRTVDTSYDTGGRPTGISYDAASVAMQYAGVTSRVSTITRTPTDSTTAQTMSYNYDGKLVTKMTTSGLVASQYSYRYNNDFALVGMTLDNGPETVFTRNEDGRLTGYGPFTITRNGPAGAPDSLSDGVLNTTLGYDSKGRLVDRSHTVNGQQEYSLQLSYNNIGKIIQKMENIGGVVNTYDYTYDVIGQLTEVKKNGTIVEIYTYDLNGNRTSRQVGISAAEIASYDAQDRLITLGNVNYQFDTNGFLTQRGNDTFQYSATGELLKATLGSGTEVTYIYDGTGRRIGRTVNGATHKYLYGNLKNPYQVTATIEPDGTISSYHYNGAGLLFAIERNSTRYYVATDQVGSPKVVADYNGVVVKTIDFDSFGNLLSDSNPGFYLPIGFAGGLLDTDTGLIRFGMRDFDSAAGRWTAKDPIFFDGGQANLYAYCGSDPVKWRDPSGLRLPDFVSINVNVAIPTPWTGTLVGVTGALSLDRNGNWYGGLGPNVGKAATILSGSATAGWLNQCGKPSEDKLKNFLSGHGVNAGGGFIGGGGITWSPGNGTATNVGLFSPQGGAGYTYSWQLGQSNISW